MKDSEIHHLVASNNSCRFAFDDERYDHEVTSGEALEIWLNGEWIPGRVEHDTELYPVQSTLEQIMRKQPPQAHSGYYFIASSGGICGLCAGMKIRSR